MTESTKINRNIYLYANEESPKQMKRNMSVQTVQHPGSTKKQKLNVVSQSMKDADVPSRKS